MGDSKYSTQHSVLSTALVVFAKAPIPGQVKTRLCPPLTPDEAATLHGSFVLDTLEGTKFAAAKLKLPLDRYLACAPATHVFFKIMEERQGVTLIDQVGDDLGARMNQAFRTLFAQGYRQVLLMGTDVPTLPLDHLKRALASLENHDLVLGPAFDGGYYLIGLKRTAPELFADIPWSTDQVLRLTQEKAAGIGLKASLIQPWRDVDTLADLEALIEACTAETKKPKTERSFSARTTGVLELLAKRLRARA
ncbi:MAG TPA: TIGR04282 family arsenosugar biosynthesis glycosyltransferase [Nitrospira sp.]|nr:TIGR04282 family arsenosugar biosynthesis glycosyltransferase [Nitrospira sp.]